VLYNATTEALIGYWPHEGRGMSTQSTSTSAVQFPDGIVLVSTRCTRERAAMTRLGVLVTRRFLVR
jgi:hypothetical protein